MLHDTVENPAVQLIIWLFSRLLFRPAFSLTVLCRFFSFFSTAVTYSITVVLFLRMRARGSLGSTDDADFGRVPCCCGNWYLPLGCLFRRYMRHLHGADEDEEDDEAAEEQRRKSSMTRAERRAAVEELLLEETRKSSSSSRRRLLLSMVRRKQKQQVKDSAEGTLDSASAVGVEAPTEGQTNASTMLEDVDLEAGVAADDDDDLSSCNGPMCSICLGDLNENNNNNNNNTTMQVLTCPHQFHRECILDWLQCRGKTECPCCRVEMVSEDDVRRIVKRTRKEQKRQAKKLGRNTTLVTDNDDDLSETEEYLGDDDGVDIEEVVAPATVNNEQQESSEQ